MKGFYEDTEANGALRLHLRVMCKYAWLMELEKGDRRSCL